MKISYSFKLGQPAQTPAKPPEKIVEYSYNEFLLDLPDHWRQVPAPENNTLCWASEAANAAITVSIDFYAVPDEKAMEVAQFCVQQRQQALEKLAPGRVTVLRESVKPYSGGGALELGYAAQIPGSTYMYLGYVSARKIFNFTLTSGADKLAAAELFNRIVGGWLRVKLP
jgi:hypothetical protein